MFLNPNWNACQQKFLHYLLIALEVKENRNPKRVLKAKTVLKYLEEGLGDEIVNFKTENNIYLSRVV